MSSTKAKSDPTPKAKIDTVTVDRANRKVFVKLTASYKGEEWKKAYQLTINPQKTFDFREFRDRVKKDIMDDIHLDRPIQPLTDMKNEWFELL